MVNGGNIMSFFEKADTDHDNFLTGQELKTTFSQLGIALSEIESQALVKLFDKNGDGRVSYSELCMYFADVTSAKAIKDQTHWAYYIFETLRRHCNGNQQSLFALFGLNAQMFKGWEGEHARIPREQFMRTLYQLQLPLSPEYEKRLFNLLDSGSGFQSQQDVDFMFFSELVGVHFQPVEFINKSFKL
jgi:Ca2+-binding EF-hand superfamily protein